MIRKKVLAKKSSWLQIYVITITIISIIAMVLLGVYSKKNSNIIYFYIFLGFSCIFLISLIEFTLIISAPFNRIQYDVNGIYLRYNFKRNEYIEFNKITNINYSQAKILNSNYGKIFIFTETKTYKISNIANIDYVVLTLFSLIENHKKNQGK